MVKLIFLLKFYLIIFVLILSIYKGILAQNSSINGNLLKMLDFPIVIEDLKSYDLEIIGFDIMYNGKSILKGDDDIISINRNLSLELYIHYKLLDICMKNKNFLIVFNGEFGKYMKQYYINLKDKINKKNEIGGVFTEKIPLRIPSFFPSTACKIMIGFYLNKLKDIKRDFKLEPLNIFKINSYSNKQIEINYDNMEYLSFEDSFAPTYPYSNGMILTWSGIQCSFWLKCETKLRCKIDVFAHGKVTNSIKPGFNLYDNDQLIGGTFIKSEKSNSYRFNNFFQKGTHCLRIKFIKGSAYRFLSIEKVVIIPE